MTIPLNHEKIKYRLTVIDNYYTEDGVPKVLLCKIFDNLEAAIKTAEGYRTKTPLKLSK